MNLDVAEPRRRMQLRLIRVSRETSSPAKQRIDARE
jgi:hypothetical protein